MASSFRSLFMGLTFQHSWHEWSNWTKYILTTCHSRTILVLFRLSRVLKFCIGCQHCEITYKSPVTSCQWEVEGKGNFFQAYATMFRQGYHIPKDKRSSNTVDNFRFHCTPPPFPNNLENKWTAAPRYESGTILVYVHQPRSGNPTGRHKSVRNSKLFSNIQQQPPCSTNISGQNTNIT